MSRPKGNQSAVNIANIFAGDQSSIPILCKRFTLIHEFDSKNSVDANINITSLAQVSLDLLASNMNAR